MKQVGYLLDTNILSTLVKDPQGHAALRVREVGADKIYTSIIVASEMQFGIRKKASAQLTRRVERLLESIQILNYDSPADVHYGEIRHFLQKTGKIIGPNDLLIAAHALSENLIMVTDNVSEFSRVPTLKVENWL
ncbi:MAG: VapC toxin protein [uncultured Thiotrichaceae bacterium]|uniref:Ribonuclease VapC n=1 Tax=uncultured Thiotrichaceae bacterium TaxID=298394 RepID=A0A6S6TML9_9GAMM|nr:MAG: VapC toxin protein [uncultured Thiotrichaceae bacterium]